MILTETEVYLLRNARPRPHNTRTPGLSHYSAHLLLRAIHRDAITLLRLAEWECSYPNFSPRQEVQRERAQLRIVKHLRELCGKRVKVAYENDPRGLVVRFYDDPGQNTETEIPRCGY